MLPPRQGLHHLAHTTDFASYEHYLASALHELVHWTGAKHRLDRELNHRFRTRSYAAEELVAELGAASYALTNRCRGNSGTPEYIGSWPQLLSDDDRAVFTAASKASQAADYLRTFSEPKEEAA